MADFVDSEAEEDSEIDEEEGDFIGKPRKHHKKQRTVRSDDEDEEEGDDEEVVKDLIDDNPIEEEDSDNESDGSGRKRKKSDDEFDDDRLEDDDYDLIEENLGVKVQRKKFKRLRRIEDDDSDKEGGDGGEDREAIERELFDHGSDHEDQAERPAPREERGETQYGSEESEGEYSETDDFIVDDEGRPLTDKRKKRPKIFADSTLQEAQDIFGVDFDYDEFEKYDDDYYEEEEEEDEEDYDDEERAKRSKKRKEKKRKPKTIYEVYEPSELARAGLTEEDNKVRNIDMPERMQCRVVPITTASEEELEEEAEWIYKLAFKGRKAPVIPSQPVHVIHKDGAPPPNATPAPAIDGDDENWDDDPPANSSSAPPTTPSASKTVDPMDEDWDNDDNEAAPVVQKPPSPKPPSSPPKQSNNMDWENDEENWDLPAPPRSEAAFTSVTTLVDSIMPEPIDPEPVKPEIISKIHKALDFMRNHHLEVPFIAFYRKEYIEPELKMVDLWKIYRLDARFCQLKARKNRLISLFKNMKDFQEQTIFENLDAPLDDTLRLITDDDLEKLKGIKSNEELKDFYLLFTLYYSDQVPSMKSYHSKKKRERIAEARAQKERQMTLAALANEIAANTPAPSQEGETPANDENIDPDAPPKEPNSNPTENPSTSGEGEGGKTETSKEGEEKVAAAANKENSEENTTAKALQSLEIEEEDDGGMALKRKTGGGTYNLCKKFGVEGLTKKFGLTPEKFAENLRDNYQKYEVDQYPDEPAVVALEYISRQLSTIEEVLRAAKFMVATQLSREPLVRQTVRDVFFERANLSVVPTKKGVKEIDELHPLYSMKYLKEKPINELVDDQWIRLAMAEEDKLITIIIGEKIRGITSPNYIDEIKDLYKRDEFIKTVQAWNNLRQECIEFAMEKILYPAFRKELRAKLLESAKEYVLTQCSKKLNEWIKVAPFVAEATDYEDEEDFEFNKGLKVLSIAYVPDFDQSSFACFIGPDGDPSDYLRLGNIMKLKNSFRESDRAEKEADLLALKNFIRQKKPHIIVIGGDSRDAMMIRDDCTEIISDLVRDDGFPPTIRVEIIDNQFAKIYGNSLKSQADFREYPIILRQAISLGRRMQDPLIEFSQLCTPDDEILCLKFHPLQDQVPKEELLEFLQEEFVNRTNEVGVDVNRALNYPYTANLLQFVCGIGSRKALAMLKTLKQNNQRLENRTQLITVCHMGPKIFINCSGFIKIDTNSLGDSTEAYVEVLDGSRVHPETYEWARKMAVDALEYDDEDANPAGALEEILESPERLKDLDLDAFADELERQGFGNKSITLYDIRSELNLRYEDHRVKFESPTSEELFLMLTKETPETFYCGRLITAIVSGIQYKKPGEEQLNQAVPLRDEKTGTWICAFCMKSDFPELTEVWNHFDAGGCPGQATGVKVRLDNGIFGFIPTSKLSDKQVVNPENRVRKGQSIYCRIIKINVERFSIECASRSSDLMDLEGIHKPKKDDYYDQEAEDREMKKEAELKKAKERQQYIKRVIIHPSFKNISFRESEKLMEMMDQGEVIIRPSSKGADHLTATWKVAENVYQHIDIKEEGKENAFSLGHSLIINDQEFEDLDEIIARYINPMASYARDIINYRYYNCSSDTGYGSRSKAEEYLLGERLKNSNKIHYVVYPSKELPGKFLLSYLPSRKVKHEYITVTPDGFRFRQQEFGKLDHVLKWFKENYKNPPPPPPSSSAISRSPSTRGTNVIARTPSYPPNNMMNDDVRSVLGAPAPSQFGAMSNIGVVATPIHHFATPGQNYTPFSNIASHTPYTPSAHTPYMTTPGRIPSGSVPHAPGAGSTASFLHPGAKTPQHHPQRIPTRIPSAPRSTMGGQESLDWRRAAEAWAKSQQNPRIKGSSTPNISAAGKSPAARNAALVIHEGIQKNKQMSSSHSYISTSKSPRPGSGRESLKSTPRTNFSPRSMVESSLGDETPLIDEY